MSEREVICDKCSQPASCVKKTPRPKNTQAFLFERQIRDMTATEVFCDSHCDHKKPKQCLSIFRHERGPEFD